MTGKIGPHDEIEFELYRKGTKHVILFSFDYQPEGHEEKAQSLGAKVLIFEDSQLKLKNYIYYRSSHRCSAERLREILLTSESWAVAFDWEEKEREIGNILGYDSEEIDAYIERVRRVR